jgi:hypothetical protein
MMNAIAPEKISDKQTALEKPSTRRSLRELTSRYFNETKWQFVIEALLFGVMAAISAWPVFAAVDALTKLVQAGAS